MKRKIRAVLFGAGNMGRVSIRSMIDHDIEIVAAIGRNHNIGKDIGELAGIGPIGIPLEKNAEEVLARVEADIAVISTESGVAQIAPLAKLCADHGMNVITIAEALNYPWNTEPEATRELDEYMKAKGVTLFGTGLYDTIWNNIPLSLASACNRVDEINMYCILGLEDMGKVVAEELYVGKTLEEYHALLAETPVEENGLARASMTYNYGNAATLRLTPDREIISLDPILAEHDTYFPQWDILVHKGELLGLEIVATLLTKENIRLVYTSYFKAFAEGEEYCHVNHIDYKIMGDPDFHLVLDNVHGEVATAYCEVNRIPDVINARPGFVTVVDLGKPMYHAKPMQEYIETE